MDNVVRISNATEEQLHELVQSGRYASHDAAVQEAVRRIAEDEAWRRALEQKVEQGLADVDAGRVHSVVDIREHFRCRANEAQ